MASHELAVQLWYLIALFGVGAVGLVCLIAGLRARRRRNGAPATRLIVVGVVLLNVGGLGIAGNLVTAYYPSPFDTDKSMRVGQCVDQNTFLATRFSSNPENSCANPANTFELAFRGGPKDTCPDGKRDGSIYNRYTDNYTILCFALNLKQGKCYQLTNGAETLTMTLGDCKVPRAPQTKVLQRIDGSTDATRCPPGDKAIAYPAPPRVYCLTPTAS
ncbi:hypothetical protein H7K33_03725 [Mycobacterium paraense]|uniref:LppU/SCO3897 family protein n=1 Tax=Mycobacterium paraense TaxID=767916 RepID=UPI000A15A536|nr:hypothetical protein [Mycobacterium paraense]MCV7441326.1 hypothetical protein [Mycobacterium paraense]ORW42936.1 hypothetical protein AWB89_18840 [Mycobacterium paraense]